MTLDLHQTKRALERIIRRDANPCTTAEARRWLAIVDQGIARPDDFAGWFGGNGYQPAIEGVIRDAGFHEKQQGVGRPFGQPATHERSLASRLRPSGGYRAQGSGR